MSLGAHKVPSVLTSFLHSSACWHPCFRSCLSSYSLCWWVLHLEFFFPLIPVGHFTLVKWEECPEFSILFSVALVILVGDGCSGELSACVSSPPFTQFQVSEMLTKHLACLRSGSMALRKPKCVKVFIAHWCVPDQLFSCSLSDTIDVQSPSWESSACLVYSISLSLRLSSSVVFRFLHVSGFSEWSRGSLFISLFQDKEHACFCKRSFQIMPTVPQFQCRSQSRIII